METHQPDLIVRLVGPGLAPTTVPIRALAKILGALQRLVNQRDEEVDEEMPAKSETAQDDPNRVMHLVDVRSSSAAYGVRAPKRDVLNDVLNHLRESMIEPNKSDWLDSTVYSIKEFSEVARSLKCQVEFREPDNGSAGRLIATIEPQTYDRIKDSAFVNGETVVFARIERVGGATARVCNIRLPHAPRKMVTCDVTSEELARRLGQFIYENVLLMGRARWLRHNWRLKRMQIRDFSPPKKGSIKESFQRLRELDAGTWDSIDDPDAYLAEMRRA